MSTNIVRRIIRAVDDEILVVSASKTSKSRTIPREQVEEFFEQKVDPPYVVEFRCRRDGKYLVDDDEKMPAIAKHYKGLTLDERGALPHHVPIMAICFLPDHYRGKRIDRAVIKRRKKNGEC